MSEGFRDLADDALRTLADSSLTERLAAVFLDRLHDLPEEDAARLAEGARDDGRVMIESGQPLDADTRRKLTRAVHNLTADKVDVAYESGVAGLVGIRLRAGSATIEWSVDDYLDRFVERLNKHFPGGPAEAPEQQAEAVDEPQRASSEAVHD
jgi:F0F1-type ATP synthase delta subunit